MIPAARARLRRVLRRPPTIADCMRAARLAPCEPTKAPEQPLDSHRRRGSGAPPRQLLVPVRILSWEAYAQWVANHPDEAA